MESAIGAVANGGQETGIHGLILEVDEDKLTAKLCLSAPLEDETLDASEVITLLQENFKLTNIDTQALVDAVNTWNEGENLEEKVLIAKGTPPIDGQDAVIVWTESYFDRSFSADADDSERIDHFNISKIQVVSEGDVIGSIKPPTKGIKGKDIFGNEIPAKDGALPSTKIGRNLVIDEKGKEITATVEGQITLHNDIASVQPVLEINGNVDFDVGRIDFPGTVIIRGNIQDGFTVIAGEELRVMGLVEAAHLESKGDMFLKGGASGKSKGKIICGGNFYARHLDNVEVEAEGDLEIKNEAVNCILHTKTVLKSPKGSIIGGEIIANKGGEIGTLGSDAAVSTKIFIGHDFEAEVQIETLNHEEKELQEKSKELEKEIKQEAYAITGRGAQAEEAHELREAITEKQFGLSEVKSKIEEIKAEKAKLWEKVKEAKKEAILIVRKHIYPGVILDVGGERYEWDVEYTRCVKIKLNVESFEIEMVGIM